MRRFQLAKMSTMILGITVVLLPVPVIMAGVSFRYGPPKLLWVAAFMALVWVAVWLLFRPSEFVLSRAGLEIRWPMRPAWRLALADIDSVEIVSGDDFRREYGRGARVGAGGLWGGFGWLVTKKGALRMYVSRVDELVLVYPKSGRTLMITPDRPELFVESLRELLAR